MKRILQKRVIAIMMSLVVATVGIFAGIKITESQNETISVVTIANGAHVRKGSIIESEMVTTTTIGAYNIPLSYVTDPKEVVGKYALADMMSNDFIQENKVATSLPSADEKLLQLDGSRIAISVTLKDFARGLSDKIVSGDIVSCLITTENGTEIPMELTYVEVVSTTMPSGIDKENSNDETDENLATATLLATPYQAKLLSEYDKSAEIHLALVYRGDEDTAKKFIEKQAEALEAISAEQSTEEDPFEEAAV